MTDSQESFINGKRVRNARHTNKEIYSDLRSISYKALYNVRARYIISYTRPNKRGVSVNQPKVSQMVEAQCESNSSAVAPRKKKLMHALYKPYTTGEEIER